MFVIEGLDKVRKTIEENRNRKLTKHKKISNNTVIEIDCCSPLESLKLYEELEECGSRLTGYKECFEIMGKDRNAFGETLEAVTADSGYCSEKNLLYLYETKSSGQPKKRKLPLSSSKS